MDRTEDTEFYSPVAPSSSVLCLLYGRKMSNRWPAVVSLWLFYFIFYYFKTGFHHVGRAGLELPTSGDPPTLASKVLGLQA